MNLTPRQNQVIAECAKLLKMALGGLKSVVFDLGNEKQDDKVRWEIHGKEIIKKEASK